MRLALVITLSAAAMLTAAAVLYADFQARRRETAELSQAVSTDPRDRELPPLAIQKKAGRSGETKGSPRDGVSKPPIDPSPPAKLGVSEISEGIDRVKAEVEKCGAGATVAIRFVLDGSTGAVTSATSLDEHASTPLGSCVASAAKTAQFPKFQAQQQDFTFKFRL